MSSYKGILKNIIKRLIIIFIVLFVLICVLIALFLIYDHYDSKRIIEQCVANGESLEICKRYID